MIHPTPRLIRILIACVLLGAGVVFVAPAVWWVMPLIMLGLMALAVFEGVFAPLPSHLTLDIPLPLRIGVGRDYGFAYAVRFRARTPKKIEIRWGVSSRLQTPQAGLTLSPDAGLFKGQLALRATARGKAAVETAHLRWSGALGLGYVQKIVPLKAEMVVTPDIEGVQQDAAALFSRDSVYGVRVQNQLHNGSEYHALREYDSSQDHRRIDWRSSARHLKLLSREFQTERNHHIVLAFDTGRLMGEPLLRVKKLDRALYAGLLLGYCALKIGDNVRSFAFAARPYHNAPLLAGTQAYETLKAQLSGLDDRPEETNHTLALADLGSKIARRSLIVLFTDFIDEISADLMLEALQRLSKKHLIVFVAFRDEVLEGLAASEPQAADDVTRAIFARRLLQQRETVHATLRRYGIEVLEPTTEAMAVQLVLKYLEMKREDRL